MKMDNDSESEKLGVIIFGQQFCSKLEHIPIKKRILLRDSALYQRTPSSVEERDQKIDSPPVSQNSDLPESPFVAQQSDPNFFSKQHVDDLKSLQFNDNSRKTVVMNTAEADHNPIGFNVENSAKDPRTDAVSPHSKTESSSVLSFAPVAKGDGLHSECSETVPTSLSANLTEDSYSDKKSTFQADHVSCKDPEAGQLVTQDNRILWDLNVEMDAWEKPDDHLFVESKSDPTTSEVQSGTNLERAADFRLKGDTVMSENDTESSRQATGEDMNSGGICKHEHTISDPAHVEPSTSVREGQQVVAGSPDKACSTADPSVEIATANISSNHELASRTGEHDTSILGGNTSKFIGCAARRDLGSLCATPTDSAVSNEEKSCDNKNIIIEGEGSVNILRGSDDEVNLASKKGTNSEAGQLDITHMSSSADQLEHRVSVGNGGLPVTSKEKIIAESVTAPSMHLSENLSESSPNHVDIDMSNPLLGRFQERCDASIAQSQHVPVKCNQGATVTNQVPSVDKDHWPQIEQDYEDGELRDLDMHCWNEDETKIGEIECLDYEPSIENVDDLDESQASVSAVGKGESELKSKKYKLSETLVKDHLVRMDGANMGLVGTGYGTRISSTQLEKKLSGWDQLPKDGYASSEKAQETHGIISRTPRSELQSCSDIPTLSEDAEDKETVVERRIRPRDMDDSYPAESGSGFDKFSGKRRSTAHMHGRYRAEDWDSDRRSSVNYHDLYDNHSGSRRVNINSKGREQCRSRSPPYDRNEAYGPHISYSRYSRGRNGSRAEGPGRSLRGGRNGYRGSLADDRSESEFCVRPQFLRRDRSFSPRPTSHFSETFNRSRSRSRTRSPPMWVPPYERLGSRVHRRSPEFSADDRVKRTRLPFWKSNFPPDTEMRYTSPPRSGYRPQNKSRWNDEEDFDLRGSRDRSPMRSFRQKEKFDSSCSRGSFKSSEDFRPVGYRGRMREITPPDRVRGYIGGKDRRKHEDSFEAGQRKRYYKDGFTRRNDAEDDIASQTFPLKEDFLEDGETRSVNMRKKESRSHERYEYDQLSYPGSTPNAKR